MAPPSGDKKSRKKRAASGTAATKGGGGGGTNGNGPAAKVARTAPNGDEAGKPPPAAPPNESLYKEKPNTQRLGHLEVPDAQEVLEIAQTRNLYKSNLFRMQLEELLKELTPKQQNAKAEAFLHAVQPVLLGLTSQKIEGDFAAEFPQLCFHPQEPYPFDFAAPTSVDIVGSYLLGTGLRSNACIDVAMEMPSPGFKTRDYLNHRYFNKRAAYVGEVHRQLTALRAASKDGPLAEVELLFEAVQGDPFRPCMVLCARNKDGGAKGKSPWSVRLLPAIASDLWPSSKLAPERNAVRPVEGDKVGTFPATAHYNSCVLEDAGMRQHLETVHRALARFPALRDAVLLLKRWASSKNFLPQQSGGGAGVFTPLNGFCLSAIATHAAQTASASPVEISSLQLFKLGLTVLATTDWASQKVVFGKAGAVALSAPEKELCAAHFYDGAGASNFFWRLGPFIADIKREAQRALRILDAEADPYEAVFGHTASPELEWDFLIRTPALKVNGMCPELRSDSVPLGSQEPVDAPDSVALPARFLSVFTEGLTDRCNRIAVRFVGDVTTRWSSKPPKVGMAVLVGIAIEALNMDRAVERGPSADDAKAVARFRDIWGAEKAGLRRFKDGSILECVSWPRPPLHRKCETSKKPSIVTQIVRHLAARHFPNVADGLDLVVGPIGFVPNLLDTGRHLWITFEAFRTHLCQLSSLPLTIKEVHPVDPAFSYTEVALQAAPPAPDGIQRILHNVVVEFEGSGRWPGETEPCRKVAAAMLLQMREELQAEMGIEGDATEDFLDIRYPEVVFRVRVFHPHELLSVAHRATNFLAKADAPLPSKEGLDRLRALWWRPRTRISLHGHVLRQPAMAGAIRLCKRWMASQMLSGYDDFVEHLVAAVFLTPSPFIAPSSAQVGFCRVCWLLESHDWSREPLVVDYDGKLTEEERLSMRSSFEHGRSEEGAVFFWVCSRFDPHAFLLQTPPPTVGTWLQQRARHALSVYNKRLLGIAPSSGWQELFALDISVFDIVLRLAQGEGAGAPQRRKGGKDGQRRAAAAFEALLALVKKLRAQLSPTCLVFYDADSHAVAIKWRPSAFLPQHHNVLMGGVPHSMLAQPGQQPLCVPNIVYLTSAIASLAEGLVLDMKVVGARA